MSGEGGVHVLHLDMDSFFVAVEVRADPSLAGRPVVVGGSGGRGVVASASYEARRYGVRSAMPTGEARRLCPGLVVLPGHHDRYAAVSTQLMAVLGRVSPVVEPVALDEAYVELSGALRRGATASGLAGELREAVRAELGLACSVGAGRTKLIAKLASKAAKPLPGGNRPGLGVLVVEPGDEAAFLGAHPARALPGVGPRTAEKLSRYGVATVADLALVEAGSLVRLLGRAHGSLLHELAHGRDPRPVEPDRPVASIGHEETFERDERSLERLTSLAGEMARAVASRCRAAEVVPRRVTVKLRFADFATITRSRTLPAPAAAGAELAAAAAELLAAEALGRGVRLLGVHASLFVPASAPSARARQLSLFGSGQAGPDPGAPVGPEAVRRHEEAEIAADEIRRRYGSGAIGSLAAATRRESAPGPGEHPA